MVQRVYLVRPAVIAPTVLSVVAIVLAVRESWFFVAALPLIWLGSVCAQPNLNLANGCLAYLAMIVGLVVVALFKPLGIAILMGVVAGFYSSAIEKWLRMRPAPDSQP